MDIVVQFFSILARILLVNHPRLRWQAWGDMVSLLTTPLVTLVVQKGSYNVIHVSGDDLMNPSWYSYNEHVWEYKKHGFRLVASAKCGLGSWEDIDFWIYAGVEPVLNIFQADEYQREEVHHLYKYRALSRYAKAWRAI